MTVLAVPNVEDLWPTLGPQVANYIEENLVFGPGDLRGQRARLDDEKRALIYYMYQVYPRGHRDSNGKDIGGRRRFRRCCWSAQKGSAKTELAAWIAACELSPEAPVRCIGFDDEGRPIGGPVVDPYIPMVAYTEEQSEDLAYAALKTILELSPISSLFDIGLERILRARGDGKAVALAGAPDSRDGARTTFSHKDETHRWTLPRLKRAHRTMLANLPKRLLADPWELETTTAYSPGEQSVAEETAEYARSVAEGKLTDSRLFYFHRQASDGYDLEDRVQLREAVVEASGPTAAWKDIDGIVDQWQDPKADHAYLERVYLNRPVQAASSAFNVGRWEQLMREDYRITDGAMVTLGFDGSRHNDSTGIIVTEIGTGYQDVVDVWERPANVAEWEVPAEKVDATMRECFERWNVLRCYCDPYWWESYVASWAGEFGAKKVVEFKTNRMRMMAFALQAFSGAIAEGELCHSGDERYRRHIGNAQKSLTNFTDDEGRFLWLIQKERPDSPFKIDLAMAGCLSWQARLDAVAAGEAVEKKRGIIAYFGDDEDESEPGAPTRDGA